VGQPQQRADPFNQSRTHAGAFRLHYLGSHPATRSTPTRHAHRRAVSERVDDHSRKVRCQLRVVVRSLKSLRPPQDTSSQRNPFSRSTLPDPLTQRQASWGWWYPWSFWRDGGPVGAVPVLGVAEAAKERTPSSGAAARAGVTSLTTRRIVGPPQADTTRGKVCDDKGA